MNINKETLKLLADIQDIHNNAENAYEEMLKDYRKEQSILGKQKAELLIKTFEEKPLSEIKIRYDDEPMNKTVIEINNDIFLYRPNTDNLFYITNLNERIEIKLNRFVDEGFCDFLRKVTNYIILKKDIEGWEEDTKKKKKDRLLFRIMNGRHNMRNSYNRRQTYAR